MVETSDPNQKISDATYLFDREDRPLIAERLITEAIEICTKDHDNGCLADAYLAYGFFFRSRSVTHWAKQFVENGFLDKSATFADRYSKSIEYFSKAAVLYTQLGRFDAVTNADLNVGFTYDLMADSKAACKAYDESAAANHENLRRNPGVKVALPDGFSSYDEYLADLKKHEGCG